MMFAVATAALLVSLALLLARAVVGPTVFDRLLAANTMGTSLVAPGCTPAYLKSGHFICSRERTDHVLPTRSSRVT